MAELTRVVLDLDWTQEPISGSLNVPGGVRVPFSGWLELVAVLERVAGPGADVHTGRVMKRSTLSVCLGALVLLTSGAGADAAHACIDPGIRQGYRSVHQPGDKFEFLVRTERSERHARRLRPLVRRLFDELRPIFGALPPGFEGPRSPYEIVFATSLHDHDNGAHDTWCGQPGRWGMLVERNRSPSELGVTLAHELFHAFRRSGGQPTANGWWDEASATWYQMVAAPQARQTERDDPFLQAPGLPVDDFSGDRLHAYGAWRFIQWLRAERRWSREATLRFLHDVFLRYERIPAAGQTAALREALARAGSGELGDLVGRFWGSRLGPDGPGPATRGERFTVQDGSETSAFGRLIAPLGARVLRYRATPGVRSLFFEFERRPDPDAKVWLMAGGRVAREWLPLDSESFCVGSPGSAAEPGWPGELALAVTNAGTDPLADLTIEVSGSSAPCEAPPSGPAAGGCPPTPPSWRAPAGFSGRIVFNARLARIDAEWGAWYRDIFLDPTRTGAGAADAALGTIRRQAELARCTAARLNGLDGIPSPFRVPLARAIQGFGDMASRLEDAGRACAAAMAAGGQCSVSGSVDALVRSGHPLFAAMHHVGGRGFDRRLTRELRRCDRLPRRHRCHGPRLPSRWFDSPL